MIKKDKIIISDIAKKADVSLSTVSLVLNNKGGVSKNKSEVILEIARKMGYIHNKKKKTNSKKIAFLKIAKHGKILNDTHSPFLSEYIEGIITKSNDLKYKLNILTYTKYDILEITKHIKKSNFAGIIVLATELYREDIQDISNINIPTVFLDAYFPYMKCNFVTMDNENNIFQLTEHLVNLGHKNIALVDNKSHASNFTLRYQAFLKVANHFNLEIDKESHISVDFPYDKMLEDISQHIKNFKSFPSAFICLNDTIAIALIKALKQHGYNIPEDISIVGHDNLPSSLFIDPSLTTIDVPKKYIASLSVEILNEEIISENKSHYRKYEISGTLIQRESVSDISKSIK